MALGKLWKRKHGPSLMDMQRVKAEIACEHIMQAEEQAMFKAIADQPRLLAELKDEREKYINAIEASITGGWRPTPSEWLDIKRKLDSFGERRKQLTDPLGLADTMRELRPLKPKVPSIYERFGLHYRKFY